ncbi:MAG: helix-turn-helix transcriptional regulator [Candidatus Limnocylindrales bacterium]
MDDRGVGASLRALRLRRGWRQADLASRCGVAQTTISLIERGHWDRLAMRSVRQVFAAVDARFVADVWWRGGELDRLLDARHAALVAATAERLRSTGWDVELEVTFNLAGERGSVDVLAGRAREGQLVVIEVKSRLMSVEEMLRRLDVKVRLAPTMCQGRFGWRPRLLSRLLVVPADSAARRRVASAEGVFASALPTRGRDVAAWLARPVGRMDGIWFVAVSNRVLRDAGEGRRGDRAATGVLRDTRGRTGGRR